MKQNKIRADVNTIVRDWAELTYHGVPGQVGPKGDSASGIDAADLATTNRNLTNAAFQRLNKAFLIPFEERLAADAEIERFVYGLPKTGSNTMIFENCVVLALKRHVHVVCEGLGGSLGAGLPKTLQRAWDEFAADLLTCATESYKSLRIS